MLALNVVDEIEQIVKRLPKPGTGSCEDVGKVAQTGHSFGRRSGIADMQDHSGCDRCRSVLPVTLLRRVLAGANDHVGDILGVRYIARSEEPDLLQRVKTGRRILLDRRELETKMTLAGPEAGRFRPVLSFDVIDDRRFLPGKEGRNHQADAFAAARRREGENMFRPIVAQIVKVIG